VSKAVEAGLDDPRVELADGLCLVRPWPTPLETRVTQRMADLLTENASDDVRVLTLGARLRLGADIDLAPDIMVVEGSPADGPEDAVSPVVTAVPRLVVEIADRTAVRFDRTYKIDLYRALGVPACWLIDTEGPTIEVFERREGALVEVRTASGSERLSLTVPLPVTIVPADLVDPPDPA
jgi:Uma2 family endonuclease